MEHFYKALESLGYYPVKTEGKTANGEESTSTYTLIHGEKEA